VLNGTSRLTQNRIFGSDALAQTALSCVLTNACSHSFTKATTSIGPTGRTERMQNSDGISRSISLGLSAPEWPI
jgi:hypothetical protein